MATTIDRVIAPRFDKHGVASYPSVTSPPSESFAICYMVPDRIIPVIFVPGVMGTNLGENIDKKKPPIAPVWLLNSGMGMAKDWITKNAKSRKKLLRPDNTDVFRGGDIPQGSIQTDTELRRRGWGEVGFSSYAEILVWLEKTLNDFNDPHNGPRVGLIEQVLEGAVKMDKVVRDEIALTYKYRFPVHAVGYNWLDSNAKSAERLQLKINEFIAFYQKNFKCEQVIVVTHSMGGLVARYCSENLGMQSKILGIVHGVMPAIGAAAVYRRMKAGTENPDKGTWKSAAGGLASEVLGGNAAEMTAVLSSAPGPLQMLPGMEYGMRWLKFHDGKNELAQMSLPKADPYSEIYTVRGKWWSLCDDFLIDPRDEKKERIETDWINFTNVIRLHVKKFHEKLQGKYHPHTYAFIGVDQTKAAYGQVQWTFQPSSNYSHETLPNDLLDVSFQRGKGEGYEQPIEPRRPTRFVGQPAHPSLMPMRISTPEEAGDGTVPQRSGRGVKDHAKAYFELQRVEHEPAYKNENAHAQRAALYGIVKIAQRIKDVAGMAYK
ncbi:MAG: hypothetical protein HHJ16_00080 [Polaromonas sp.]|uniref:esterase/lipase family protein n=1 Tax=Polaromonas sp. TaxID=1869339 RepID=UPI00180A9154|nr:hypothetical protein [Polaromonas sp.]NMM08661.1 hypothetical protein [Polaromonas sp.]